MSLQLLTRYGLTRGGGAALAAYEELGPAPATPYPSAAAGKANAVRHDGDPGASNYLTVPYNAALIPSTSALTVEWRGVLHSSSSNGLTLLELPYGTAFSEPFYVYNITVNPVTRRLTTQLNVSGTRRFADVTGVPGIAAGTLMHLAMTYDGATIKAYANGRLVASAAFAGTIQTSNQPLFVGRHGNTTTLPVDMTTDMIRIWSVVRTEQELAAAMDQEIDPATSGLSAYWKMNEGSGTTVADEVGSNDMNLVGTCTWATSFVWDGTNNERHHIPTVLELPNPYSTIQVIHPSMVYVPGGFGGYEWWALYTPYPVGDGNKENPCVAASSDGLLWEEPVGLTNPISTPATGYDHGDTNLIAVNVAGTPTLWAYFRQATESSGSPGDETIYRMSSTDGVTWENKTTVLSDASGTNRDNLLSPTVFYDSTGSQWVMLTVNNTAGEIQRRTSADGVTWSAAAAVTLTGEPAGNPWHLEARPAPTGTRIHIVAQFNPSTDPTAGRIYYGYSDDAGATITLTGTAITSAKHATFAQGEYRASLVFDPNYQDRLHLFMSGYRIGGGAPEIVAAKITRRLASGDLYQENAGPL